MSTATRWCVPFSTATVRLLLPGDIEDEAERLLLERRADLSAQVLKVPHHGGRTSSGLPFLDAGATEVAIVSAGYRNRFRHPHQETLERYRGTASSCTGPTWTAQ